MKKLSIAFSSVAVILAGIISQYASQKPDGLEWSLLNIHSSLIAGTQGYLFTLSEAVQAKTAVLASISSIPANIIGLTAVGITMYFVCIMLKPVNE